MAGISRKGFILGSLATAGGTVCGDVAQGGFREPVRNLPLAEDADLIVAGGGPAGIAAGSFVISSLASIAIRKIPVVGKLIVG